MYNPRLGLMLLFPGDHRKVNATIKNVGSFTAASGILKQGDTDVTNTYVTGSPTFAGNMLITGDIGIAASIPAGTYRYYITGTYSGRSRTWYWDVLVVPKDNTLWDNTDYWKEDFDPYLGEVVLYSGDTASMTMAATGIILSAATGVLIFLGSDVTSTYCSSSVSVTDTTLTTHLIGGNATIPPGDYAYFVTGTYNNSEAKTTWYWLVKVLPKQSPQ